MIVVTCPECDKKINLPETSVGRRVRCSGCQAIVLVSPPSDDLPAAAPPPQRGGPPPLPRQNGRGDEPNEPIDEPPANAAPRPFRPQTPPARLGFWLAVVVVGLLIVGGGIFAAMYLKK